MTSTHQQILATQINQHHLTSILRSDDPEIKVIGIDGPTAAGKTILANQLAEQIETTYSRPCWIFRLDWTLVARKQRESDLAALSPTTPFKLEAELHMRLSVCEYFLKEVALFNAALQKKTRIKTKTLTIKDLYSRDMHGEITGAAKCELKTGLVILVEGHYTLNPLLDQYIDLNILLLGDPGVFLNRKIERVKHYRSPKDTAYYYHQVDVPSFQHHLERYIQNADLIIDNTDYCYPHITDDSALKQWQTKPPQPEAQQSNLCAEELAHIIFSGSKIPTTQAYEQLESAIHLLIEWDQHVGQYLRLSLSDIKTDLTTIAHELFKAPDFIIKHTNALHHVYYRQLPITLGIELNLNSRQTIALIADVFEDQQRIQIIWNGGYHCFIRPRMLGNIDTKNPTCFHSIQTPSKTSYRKPVPLITPTTYMIPSFLNAVPHEPMFSGHEDENLSAAQALVTLIHHGGVWVHRFAKFSELNYFIHILKLLGAKTIKAGNYLIALITREKALNKAFEAFSKSWQPSLLEASSIAKDEAALDQIINEERDATRKYIQEQCPDFLMLDGQLQCPYFTHERSIWERLLKQFELMLSSPYRLLRKRATQFIQRHIPEFSIPTDTLWPDVKGDIKRISLDAYTSITPSILAELYLWLALRDDRSAILGANIYDIRTNSADCHAYMEAASERNTAIVLQASLNALGQKEEIYEGYLKPSNAAQDLINAALTAARDFFLIEGKEPPLFGIGLDHVDALNDYPAGRAQRFLQKALESGQITHCVLDGSALFQVENDQISTLTQAFDKVTEFAAGLFNRQKHYYIIDKEICSGELNYVGKQTEAMIPTDDQIAVFAGLFRQKMRSYGLGAFNTRPTLFIGNLGTTHHNYDTSTTAVHQSHSWRERIKSINFISPVLHGTTQSHPSTLSNATVGCHKINVAGDLLTTLIKTLPKSLREEIEQSTEEPKKSLYKIRNKMNNLSQKEISHQNQSLKAHCRHLFDTLNAPQLTSMDVCYFRYKNYQYPKQHIDVILEELANYAIDPVVKHSSIHTASQLPNLCLSASLIEVPFNDHYKAVVESAWAAGIRYFHIDAGDGKFISRSFCGLDKADYLRTHYPESVLHAHLMIENPHLSFYSNSSAIERYIKAGCDAVAIHLRSLNHPHSIIEAIEQIRALNARAGVILETTDSVDETYWQFIFENEINWVVVMGVPVGYGGQIFDMSTLNRISALRHFSIRDQHSLLIEVDGGLTKEIIPLCYEAGGQIFSGWSMIKAEDMTQLKCNIETIQSLLNY